jgi:hypothetical protein
VSSVRRDPSAVARDTPKVDVRRSGLDCDLLIAVVQRTDRVGHLAAARVDAVEKQDRIGRPRLNVCDEPPKFFGDLTALGWRTAESRRSRTPFTVSSPTPRFTHDSVGNHSCHIPASMPLSPRNRNCPGRGGSCSNWETRAPIESCREVRLANRNGPRSTGSELSDPVSPQN